MTTHVPPGWPAVVPPPGAPGWEQAAISWLLDQCPADFRGYHAWQRHPLALAWIAARHVAAQVEVLREAYRQARVDLGGELPPEALPEVLEAIEAEGLRLRAAALGTRLIEEALRGVSFRPRL